jgi:hypothetical protein
MAEQTIRDRVRVIERAMLQGGLQPAQVREFLSTATALLGWCNREVTDATLAFNTVLADARREAKTAAAARIVAESSLAYARKRVAEDEQANCEEIVRTLKVLVRSLDSEMKLGA